MGFWVFGSKIKNTGFSPLFAPFAANHTPGPSAGARAFFCCSKSRKAAVQPSSLLLLSLRCRTRGLFFLQAMDMQIEQVHCRTAVVSDLPYGGAGPPVRLLSLTSFSAGDLVHRLCMSSSYGCASCRLCLLRHRVSSALVPTSFPQLLDWLTGSSHSSRSFIIQGNTEVKDLPGPGQCE